jgi:hypothetical protein
VAFGGGGGGGVERRPVGGRAAVVERVPTAGGRQGRAGGGQRLKEVFFTFAGRVGPGETSAGGYEMGRGRRRG